MQIPLHVLMAISTALGVKPHLLLDFGKDLGKRFAPSPGGRRKPRDTEEEQLVTAWRELSPRERQLVVTICKSIKGFLFQRRR